MFDRFDLLRDARLAKYARDGRADVAVLVLVFTNEHEYRHRFVLCRNVQGEGPAVPAVGENTPRRCVLRQPLRCSILRE
jgi:hypothetical protein